MHQTTSQISGPSTCFRVISAETDLKLSTGTPAQVWYDIEELGIDVECTWHPTECREGWRNEEFDPLVYNVVVFLEDLGPDVMMC
jgi:hypothetical protein